MRQTNTWIDRLQLVTLQNLWLRHAGQAQVGHFGDDSCGGPEGACGIPDVQWLRPWAGMVVGPVASGDSHSKAQPFDWAGQFWNGRTFGQSEHSCPSCPAAAGDATKKGRTAKPGEGRVSATISRSGPSIWYRLIFIFYFLLTCVFVLFYGSRNCSIIFASVFHNLCFSQARAYLHDQHPAAAAALSDEKLPTDDYHWIASFLHCNYVSMIFFLDQPQPVDSSSYQRFFGQQAACCRSSFDQ